MTGRAAGTARGAALAVVLALAAAGAVARAADVPFLTGRVVDNAEILKAPTRETLAGELKAHEAATSNQIAVLTVPNLDGDSIEDYAAKVFATWKLGQKGKDNGVLVVVAPRDRKMRIEVGYGLEGTLTDLICGRVIREVMTPAFKAGDYDGGVSAGVRAVVGVLEGKGLVAAPSRRPAASWRISQGPDMPWQVRILAGLFIFGIIGLFTFIGVMTPGVGWFLYVFLLPFWATFPMVIIGVGPTLVLLVVYVVGYPLTKVLLARTAWYKKAREELKTKGRTSIGGFVFTTGSSGGSSSSSGGGASGGW